MAVGAYGGLRMLMVGNWCLWRPVDANGWLLVPMDAMDGYWCLWRPMDASGWLLVPMEACGC